MLKKALRNFPGTKRLYRKLNTKFERDEWVKARLSELPDGIRILDAGCGSQRYREYCTRFDYRSQDFGQFEKEDKKLLGNEKSNDPYNYGDLDYISNIWEIPEKDGSFDAILCTEVLEHVPYPIETVKELRRLLKPQGTLILTTPSNCLRHMDPYYFTSGFSDRWFERILPEAGLQVREIEPVGDYYSWLATEMARTGSSHSFIALISVLPALVYFLLKRATPTSISTLCTGYHVLAIRSGEQVTNAHLETNR